MNNPEQIVRECVEKSDSRFNLWIRLIKLFQVKNMAEVRVYKGDLKLNQLKIHYRIIYANLIPESHSNSQQSLINENS